MNATKLGLALGLLVLGACSADPSGSSADEKLAARLRMERPGADAAGSITAGALAPDTPVSSRPSAPADDECQRRSWYGDGECDAWCPKGDVDDCASSGTDGVACAEFFAPADGYCNLKDPCGPMQDEDCQKPAGDASCGATDAGGYDPDDGKCEPHSYMELKADPDCADLICPALFSPADGKCNARSACDFLIDEDCSQGSGGGTTGSPGAGVTTPIACIDIAYPTDGKCEAAKGCEDSDPVDCRSAVACIEIAYPANGKCEAAKGCEYTDPSDCGVVCDLALRPQDGRCEAAVGCEHTDPDCGVVCLAIAYAENGRCEAAKGCEAADPDC